MKNRFRQSLLQREPTFGSWIQIGHPAIAEVLAGAGFDWVAVDVEHGIVDLSDIAHLFRAIELHGAVPVARLPFNDPIWIKRVLDAGACGLIIPMVNSAAEARAAMDQAKYPPLGCRGYGYSRANQHGREFDSYIRRANEEIAIVMQIEHRRGIEEIDAILEVPGVDAAFIGPLDLSGSYGKTGQLEDPEIVEALRTFRASCQGHSISAGMHLVHPTAGSIQQALRDGYTMMALGLDNTLLAAAAGAALDAARDTVATVLVRHS
ncbi:MAG: 2,4-dihydroxyhept-2-ene-1,7-dioic acid aldolase [Acidobacteria bacterium]|nr:2,4-dihydroxyhept-2-ene-1,7-dioic acid aldolase [Acidobacteriota bacterium]